MFNTTIHKYETTVTPVTRVVEKSITPDKVTDMYDKVRAEVEKDFVQSFRIEGNTLNGIVVELQNRFDNNTRVIFTRFVLNGKDHQAKEIIQATESLDQYKAVELIKQHYEDFLAGEITKDALRITNPKPLIK